MRTIFAFILVVFLSAIVVVSLPVADPEPIKSQLADTAVDDLDETIDDDTISSENDVPNDEKSVHDMPSIREELKEDDSAERYHDDDEDDANNDDTPDDDVSDDEEYPDESDDEKDSPTEDDLDVPDYDAIDDGQTKESDDEADSSMEDEFPNYKSIDVGQKDRGRILTGRYKKIVSVKTDPDEGKIGGDEGNYQKMDIPMKDVVKNAFEDVMKKAPTVEVSNSDMNENTELSDSRTTNEDYVENVDETGQITDEEDDDEDDALFNKDQMETENTAVGEEVAKQNDKAEPASDDIEEFEEHISANGKVSDSVDETSDVPNETGEDQTKNVNEADNVAPGKIPDNIAHVSSDVPGQTELVDGNADEEDATDAGQLPDDEEFVNFEDDKNDEEMDEEEDPYKNEDVENNEARSDEKLNDESNDEKVAFEKSTSKRIVASAVESNDDEDIPSQEDEETENEMENPEEGNDQTEFANDNIDQANDETRENNNIKDGKTDGTSVYPYTPNDEVIGEDNEDPMYYSNERALAEINNVMSDTENRK